MCRVTFDFHEQLKNEKKYLNYINARGPTWACIELNNTCNYKCEYCLQQNNNNSDLSISEWCSLLDTFKQIGIIQVSIIGGEPTLSRNLLQIISYCKTLGMIVSLCSNGSRIDSVLARKLALAGLDQIQINLESVDLAKHNKIRRAVEGSISPTAALLNCREAGIATVMATVVTKHNYKEVPNLMELAKQNGINSFRLWRQIREEGKSNDNYFETAVEAAYSINESLGVKSIKTTSSKTSYNISSNAKYTGCPGGTMSICVSSDGSIFPCSFMRRSFGNIKNKNLVSIIHNMKSVLDNLNGDLCCH